MKKFLFLLLSGAMTLGASAYEVDFNSPISTGDLDFRVAPGWRHLVSTGGYTSDRVQYTYETSGGIDDSGCLRVGDQRYYDYYEYEYISLNDLLVTPLVSGTVSIDVKAANGAGNISFYKVENVNGKLTRGEKIEIENPELVTIDFTTVTLPEIEEPTMIGIRGSYVYLDNFYAENAEVLLEPSLAIASVAPGQGTGKIYCNEDNNFTIRANVQVKNNGDVELVPGEEGYCLKLVMMKKNESGDYVVDRVFKEVPINQTLAIGEISSVIEVEALISESEVEPENGADTKARRYDIQEGITNTLRSVGNYTPVPYLPVPVLTDNAERSIIVNGETEIGIVQGGDSYTIKVKNEGAAPMVITGLTAEGSLFTTDTETPITIATDETALVNITFSSEVIGAQTGTLIFNYEEGEGFRINLKADVLDPTLWYVNFNDGEMPINMIAQGGWQVSDDLEYADFYSYAVNKETVAGQFLISPLLEVGEGQTFRFDAARNYGEESYLNVYYSADRSNWTLLRALSKDAENEEDLLTSEYVGYTWGANTKYKFTTFTISDIPAGNYYIGFEAGNARVDNLLGFKEADVEHDIYAENLNVPATGMVNHEYVAIAAVRNLTNMVEEAGSYTAVLMSGDEVLAEAETVDIPAYGQIELSFAFTPHAAETIDLYMKIVGENFESATVPTEVAISEELLTGDVQVGECNENNLRNSAPLALYYYNSQSENIYTAQQLGLNPGTKIEAIRFRAMASYAKTINATEFTVRIENTDDETPTEILFDQEKLDAMTLIHEGEYTFKVEGELSDVINLTLDTPFEYTGSNLRIVLDSKSSGYVTSYFELDNRYENQSIFRSSDSSLPATFSTSPLPVMYLTISQEAPMLKGRITNQNGDPVADAEVKLTSGDVQYSGVSDVNGDYEIQVIQSTLEYTLNVITEQYDPYTTTVQFEDGEDVVLDITLAGELTGVSEINAENENEMIYDLNGVRQTEKPNRGMYIINGKTQVVR